MTGLIIILIRYKINKFLQKVNKKCNKNTIKIVFNNQLKIIN